MRSVVVSMLSAFALVSVLIYVVAGSPDQTEAAPSDNVIPGQYIVTLKPGEKPRGVVKRLAKDAGIDVKHIYEHALIGFSATIPENKLKQVKKDPAVLSVVEDRIVTATNDISPTGIRRSEADRNALAQLGSHSNPILVDVAVIDTGITANHPDLNVVGGVNCVQGTSSWEDAHGHGTHVAGTIGALDNGSGVVGVAPGVRLWAVRVLDANGEGEFSDVACGVDWVTGNAAIIEVANMSLAGEGPVANCTDGSLHQAICQSVAAGITYVVAAGNNNLDASGFVPAAYDEVITVSALADTDGMPGGVGPTSYFYGNDDTLATFSNYGQPVDIAAPGVNILSTWLNGAYNTISGTSMASPHVAGAAAIYQFQNPGASPVATKAHILSYAWEQTSPGGFTGDRDPYAEPVLNAGAIGGLEPLPPPPPPVADCSLSADSGTVGSSTTLTCSGFQSGEWVWVHWDSADSSILSLIIASGSGDGSATFNIPNSVMGDHSVFAVGSASGTESVTTFTVEPSAQLSNTSGAVGNSLAVTFKGYLAGETVEVRWYQDATSYSVLKSATVSATGSVTAYVTVPQAASGDHTIETASLTSGISVSSTYTVVPGLKLSPTQGKPGSNVTATVSGFKPGEGVDILWSNSVVANGIADDIGIATLSFIVPEGVNGPVDVTGQGSMGSVASSSFIVTAGLTLSATSGVVGAPVTVMLTAFAAGETVRIDWHTGTSFQTIETLPVSLQGGVSTTFDVPESIGGTHKISATGLSSGKSANVYFVLQTSIDLSETSGPAGIEVTAMMKGYGANETVNLSWFTTAYASELIASVTTTALGAAAVTFNVPTDASFGDHKVESVAASGLRRVSTIFTVQGDTGPVEATCLFEPDSGIVGTRVAVECYGFGTGEWVRVYWDTTASSQKTMIYAANGSGSGTVTIPEATAGQHLLIGVGSNSGNQSQALFNVLPSLVPSTNTGNVGGYVYANVRGFAGNETVDIHWNAGGSSIVVKSVITSSTGKATASFPVPETVGGSYVIEAIGRSSGESATTNYTVIGGVKLTPASGKYGSNLNINLSGFDASEAIDLFWDGAPIGSVNTSSTGSTTLTVPVPEAVKGAHTVSAYSASSGEVSATFTVTSSIVLSDTRGPVGMAVTATLTGYGSGETIRIDWYDTSATYSMIANVTASSLGSATVTFDIPDATIGFHYIKTTGLSGSGTVTAYFTVTSNLELSDSQGPVDTSVTVRLTGYKANELVNLKWYTTTWSSTVIATGNVDALGSGTITFSIPSDASSGSHKVEGVGASSNQRANDLFTVV